MQRTPRLYFCTCLLLSGLLAACGPDITPTTLPAAAAPTVGPNLPPTWTPAPATTSGTRPTVPPASNSKPSAITPLPNEDQPETTVGPPPGVTPLCFFVADYAFPPLAEQLKEAQDIVQVQVGNIGPLTWNTADGKQPANGCDGNHYQYSSIELTVKESYKGSLPAGSKLTIWQTGAPGSLAQGNYDYFPKTGEPLVLFLAAPQNIRPDTPNQPLNTQPVRELYRLKTPGVDKWVSQTTNTPFSLEYLKVALKDPAIIPTATPFPPSPTAYARAGQTFQPTKYYKLETAKSVYFKNPPGKPGLSGTFKPGDKQFDQLVKAFDQPLKVVQNLAEYPSYDGDNYLPFGFELPDNTTVSFVYDPTTNSLTHRLTDDRNLIQLAVPPELKAFLGF